MTITISLRDFVELSGSSGPRMQFTVTYIHAERGAFVTEKGWTIDQMRVVYPPRTRTARGVYFPVIDAVDWFLAEIRDALMEMEVVKRTLGPAVEGITLGGRTMLDGEAEVGI